MAWLQAGLVSSIFTATPGFTPEAKAAVVVRPGGRGWLVGWLAGWMSSSSSSSSSSRSRLRCATLLALLFVHCFDLLTSVIAIPFPCIIACVNYAWLVRAARHQGVRDGELATSAPADEEPGELVLSVLPQRDRRW